MFTWPSDHEGLNWPSDHEGLNWPSDHEGIISCLTTNRSLSTLQVKLMWVGKIKGEK